MGLLGKDVNDAIAPNLSTTTRRPVIAYTSTANQYWKEGPLSGGDRTWGWNQNSLVTVERESGAFRLTPEFHIMKHLSRFVPAGPEPLALSGSWAAHGVAFRNTSGKTVTILQNPHPETASVQTETDTVHLPPESVTTLVD